MFSELFKPVAATQSKNNKKRKPAAVKPASAKQHASAPFKATKEKSPEPAQADMLDHEDIAGPVEDVWDDDYSEECKESDASDVEDYEVTSMTMSDEPLCSSIDSSPGMFFERHVKVESKKRPPGIAVFFDDDSWID